MKKVVVLAFLLLCQNAFCQVITRKSIEAKIQKAMLYDETQKDSLKILANEIKTEAAEINAPEKGMYYYRFMGFYYEYEGDLEKALSQYIYFLKLAEKKEYDGERYQAWGDIYNIYAITNQPAKGKKILLKAIASGEKEDVPKHRLGVFYNNLGAHYRQENKFDSALYYFQKAYKIKEEDGDSLKMANLKMNMAVLYAKQGNFEKALSFNTENIRFHTGRKLDMDLWFDYSNMAEIFAQKNDIAKAKQYLENSLNIARKAKALNKQILSLESLSDLTKKEHQFENSLTYLLEAKTLKDQLINVETNEKIAELQEKYNTEKKDQENKLLQGEIDKQKAKNIAYLIGIVSAFLVTTLLGFFGWKNKKKNRRLQSQNDLIQHQNHKLKVLNNDKNELISVVSHELSLPFTTVKLWSDILRKKDYTDRQGLLEVAEVIESSSLEGLGLINNILDTEKAETNVHITNFEQMDLVEICEKEIAQFKQIASEKDQRIIFTSGGKELNLVSDDHLMSRVIRNLISNALKFSERGTTIEVNLIKGKEEIELTVRDQGSGIAEEEMAELFRKYGRLSNNSTYGEKSNGIGLNICKRIMDELGGKISAESELNKGSVFKVQLPI